MKKLLFLTVVVGVLGLAACAYHSKQPIDQTYYKKTQGIAWPEEEPVKTDKPVFVDERG